MSDPAGHEVIIQVGDLAAAVRFYTELCGLRHVRDIDVGGSGMSVLDADGLRIVLVQAEGPGMQLSLPTSQIAAREERLRAAGATLTPPEQLPGGVWLSFEDPWGNRLGLWQDQPAEA